MATYEELVAARKVVEECSIALRRVYAPQGEWEYGREADRAHERDLVLQWLLGELASLVIQSARASRELDRRWSNLDLFCGGE